MFFILYGPTDATGAFISSQDVVLWSGDVMEIKNALDSKNSYGFWSSHKKGENLVKGGKTGTNLMDVQMLLLDFS
uniref:MOFRL domain-containing protein n=1 Tax=Ditylenchus dipsaci TaxID=166011 RepID=A0A915D4Q9_9BILA